MKKNFCSMLSVVLVLSILSMALPLAAAAELKPMVTVSFSGYSELKADVEAFGKLAGRPELAQLLEGMLAMVTQGKGLAMLDQNQPLGIVVLNDSEDFTGYGFLPVSDLPSLMELMKNVMGGESPKLEHGMYEIPLGAVSVYATQKGKWTYVSQNPKTFDAVSNDPASLLGDMPKRYLLAVRASVKNIPDSMQQKALAFLTMFMQSSMQPPEIMKQNIEQIERWSKELDEVMLGVTLDRQTNSSYLDLELTAKPGTNMAAELAATKPGKTDFAGLKIPGAAVTFNYTVTLTDEAVARAKKTMDIYHAMVQDGVKEQDLSKEQLDLATDVLNQLFDVAAKTIELKKTDCGLAVVLEPNALTVAAGSVVADGAKLEDILKKLLAEAEKNEPDTAKLVKLNAETYKGVRFDVFSVPVPPDPKLAAMVGDMLDVVLGISDKKVFIAAGRDAAKTLKEVIDKSQTEAGKEVPAYQVVVSGLKIAKFASAIADDDMVKNMADKIAGSLEQSGGKDHLTIVTEPIPNGTRVRLELEEGILKALGGIQPGMPMGQ